MFLSAFGLSGCERKPEYDPEKDAAATLTQTDFFKVQLFVSESMEKWARVYDLTELGKQQEILVIPEDVEGYPVTQIGVSSKKHGIKSNNLKKIYIPQTVYSKPLVTTPIAKEAIICQDGIVFLSAEKIDFSGITSKDTRIIMMSDTFARSTQAYSQDAIANIKYRSPNIIYHYNYEASPNKDIYWLDFIEKDSLSFNPEAPKREEYIFTGWYEDINCHEKWDGISPSNGEDILELYAGWGKEPEEYTEGLVFRLMEDKEEYEVVGYEGADTNVIIPSLYMNLPVSKIGEKAFSFPASTHVVSILLPDSIKEIHKNSFIGTNLTGELFIPKSMYYFGHIEGVKNCQVRVKSNHDYHKEMMVNNVLTIVSKDEKELIYVNNTKEVNATFEVPNSITKIGDFSMYRSNFKEIVLPNTITVVGEKAFMYSKAVVNIPTGIKEIHANAYVRCILNENLILPEGLEVIGNGAFGENNLISVVFPSTLMTLGNGVFYSQTTVDGAYNLVKHIEFKSFQLDTTSTTAFDFAFLWLNYKDTSIKEITVKLPSDETQAQKLKNSLLQQIESDNVIRYLGNDFVINFE